MAGPSIWSILVSRLLQGIFVVWAVVTIVFFVSRVTADPVEYMVSDNATPAQIAELRDAYGLSDPLYQQYGNFLWDASRLDLGVSYVSGRPAIEEIRMRMGKTLELGIVAFLISVAAGIPLGVIAGLKRGTIIDRLARLIAAGGQAIPAFFLGLLMIFFFGARLGWLPTGGSGGISHIVMPAIVLGAVTTAVVMRLTRSAIIEVMSADFVRTARAKGLPERIIVLRHALRHALLPVTTVLGIQAGRMIAGSVIVEVVFAWPGVGRLVITSIRSSDYPVTQTAIILIAGMIVFANFVVDVLYRFIDPRISAGAA